MSSGKTAADPTQWLDEFGDSLFRYAVSRTRNQELAEDLVQETLVRGFEAYSGFRHECSVQTWLFQILRNEIAGHFRKTARKNERQFSESEELPLGNLLCSGMTNDQFQSQIEKDEFWQAIELCIQQLPNPMQTAFRHRLLHPDEKVENLCNELGISPSNFNVRLFRARLLLRKCLELGWLSDDDRRAED